MICHLTTPFLTRIGHQDKIRMTDFGVAGQAPASFRFESGMIEWKNH